MYKLIRAILFKFDPEIVHELTFRALKFLSTPPMLRNFFNNINFTKDQLLTTQIEGISFPTPFGLAAGFDKNAAAISAWPLFGFGFVEVGTVTADPQPGNPRPRLFRLTEDQGLLNRMGFNNAGAKVIRNNLSKAPKNINFPIGINIGKNKQVPNEQAAKNYLESVKLVESLGDFLIINISSPNTPNLRKLQESHSIEKIITTVKTSTDKPIFVKIAPDMSFDQLDEIIAIVIKLKIAGIVATNTTISRENLETKNINLLGEGGISGSPLTKKSKEFLKYIYTKTQGKLAIISVGGVDSPAEVWERITLGANLVETYTGFIYQGPLFPYKVNKYLIKKLQEHNFKHISEAVGISA